MSSIEEFVANLIKSELSGMELQELPIGIELKALLEIMYNNHLDLLMLSSMLNIDDFSDNKDMLQEIAIQRVIMSSIQMDAYQRIHNAFEREGIKNHPLKGIIMKGYYPKSELRQMSDIDILVDLDKIVEAREILVGLGYEFWGKEHHHDIYYKGKYLMVEIHHTLYDECVDKGQDEYFGTFERSVLSEGSNYTYEFSNEDFYIYMIAHMAKHFYARGCGVRNLIDIYVYKNRYKGQLDEDYIDRELKKTGLNFYAHHMEAVTEIWLGDKESTPFYDDVLSYMLNSGIYGKDENGIWNKFAKEIDSSGKSSRFKLRRWYYFPPLYYMKDYYPVLEKKPWLLPGMWMVRGVLGIFGHKGMRKRELLKSADGSEIKKMQKIYREMKLDFNIK